MDKPILVKSLFPSRHVSSMCFSSHDNSVDKKRTVENPKLSVLEIVETGIPNAILSFLT